MPSDNINFRGLVSRAVKGGAEGDAGEAKALREEQLQKLLQSFAKVSGDTDEIAWLKTEYPTLHTYLTSEKVERKLVRGVNDADVLKNMAKELDKTLVDDKAGAKWREVGLSPAYEGRAKALYNDESWQFIQSLPDQSGTPKPRFVMPESSFRALVIPSDERGLKDRMTNWELKDDVKERLQSLGVLEHEIYVGKDSRPGALGLNRDYIHLDPNDAALLLDAHALGQRGANLCKREGWPLVRRMALAGEVDRANVFVMPATDFLGMRGIAYNLDKNATPEQIVERCQQRLKERGIDDPQAQLAHVDGEVAIVLPTDQARVLLAPMASGDPAGRLAMVKMTGHDPNVEGYSAENGVFLVQVGHLAYFDEELVKQYTEAWGFTDTVFIDNASTSAQAFTTYDPDKNTVVIGFRGTQEAGDAWTDANFIPTSAEPYGTGTVHQGFKAQLDSISNELLAAIKPHLEKNPPAKIMLGGHSLGGALAVMFAGLLERKGMPVAQIYTGGQPKVGNDDFAKDLAKRFAKQKTSFFRYVNNTDIVPRVPPQWNHGPLGVELYIDRNGELQEPENNGTWHRIVDGVRSTAMNVITGGTFTRGPDSIADHSPDTYLGLVRKNRDKTFEPSSVLGRVKHLVRETRDAVHDVVDAAAHTVGNAIDHAADAVQGVVAGVADAVDKPDEAQPGSPPPSGSPPSEVAANPNPPPGGTPPQVG